MQMSSDDAASNCRPGFPQQEKKKEKRTQKMKTKKRRKQVVDDGGKTDLSGVWFAGAVRRVFVHLQRC